MAENGELYPGTEAFLVAVQKLVINIIIYMKNIPSPLKRGSCLVCHQFRH
jgi:hypothetical protein